MNIILSIIDQIHKALQIGKNDRLMPSLTHQHLAVTNIKILMCSRTLQCQFFPSRLSLLSTLPCSYLGTGGHTQKAQRRCLHINQGDLETNDLNK